METIIIRQRSMCPTESVLLQGRECRSMEIEQHGENSPGHVTDATSQTDSTLDSTMTLSDRAPSR